MPRGAVSRTSESHAHALFRLFRITLSIFPTFHLHLSDPSGKSPSPFTCSKGRGSALINPVGDFWETRPFPWWRSKKQPQKPQRIWRKTGTKHRHIPRVRAPARRPLIKKVHISWKMFRNSNLDKCGQPQFQRVTKKTPTSPTKTLRPYPSRAQSSKRQRED